MLNSRALPLTLGAVGGCAGIAAAVTASPVLGVLAGAAALGAGASTVRLSAIAEERADVARREDDDRRTSEIAGLRRQLDDATTRAAQLEGELRSVEAVVDEHRSCDAAPTATEALTDPETDLFSEAYFRVALDARIASARRHLRPVAIGLLEIAEGLPVPAAAAAPPERAAESIRQTVRDADTACRLSDGVFAVILEDTPENGAVWTVERVRRNLVSRYGNHTMWAGVACYPAHAFSADELIEQARLALSSAREWKQDRIEVAIAD